MLKKLLITSPFVANLFSEFVSTEKRLENHLQRETGSCQTFNVSLNFLIQYDIYKILSYFIFLIYAMLIIFTLKHAKKMIILFAIPCYYLLSNFIMRCCVIFSMSYNVMLLYLLSCYYMAYRHPNFEYSFKLEIIINLLDD